MLVNLTPHDVVVFGQNNEQVAVIPATGNEARVGVSSVQVGTVSLNDEIVSIVKSTFGEVLGLPERQDGTFYIVSRMVISACPDREDLIVPDDLVRDEDGRVVGCRRFSR
jgi:hypothetical protein